MMGFGTFGSTVLAAGPQKDPGATDFYAHIGSPSPDDPDRDQRVTNRPANTFLDTVRYATKSTLNMIIGFGNTQAALTAQGVSALGKGVQAAGEGVKTAASSATSGVKIGVAIIVVVLGIILLGYTRSALKAN